MPRRLIGLGVTLALIFATLVLARPADGLERIDVTTVDDEMNPFDDDDALSLREAVAKANALARPVDIHLGKSKEYTLDRGCKKPTEEGNLHGDLDLVTDANVVIYGNGSVIRQGCRGERLIHTDASDSTLTIKEATLTGGTPKGSGGAVLALRPVAFFDVDVSGNRADTPLGHSWGGAVFAEKGISVSSSRMANNHANSWGGAIFSALGPVLVQESTIADNTAALAGGGIYVIESNVTVLDSTLSGNRAELNGGVTLISGKLVVGNSTVTGNISELGGALASQYLGIELDHSTVVGNSTKDERGFGANVNASTLETTASVIALGAGGPDCSAGRIESHGFNFLGDGSCELDGPGDTINGGDPELGPLVDNGGPTLTRYPENRLDAHGRRHVSPLVDAVPLDSCGLHDQRGVDRPSGNKCDIGSVEARMRIDGPELDPGGDDTLCPWCDEKPEKVWPIEVLERIHENGGPPPTLPR